MPSELTAAVGFASIVGIALLFSPSLVWQVNYAVVLMLIFQAHGR